MKAKEIFQILLNGANTIREQTCDGLIAGDENKTVHKIATCFKLTAEVLDKAMESNVDMIITHEPTFSQSDDRQFANEIDLKKWEMLDSSGIVLYRFHDHAHDTEPDYIHAGFIKAIDLKIKHKYERESLGICRYELAESVTTRELAVRIKEKLGVEFVRIVGMADEAVKTVCLGLGSVGYNQIEKLINPGCDLFITGEVGEVCIDEFIRDACYFGEKKSILVLGHYSSEYAGMRLLAETMNEKILPTVFLEGGEVYYGI